MGLVSPLTYHFFAIAREALGTLKFGLAYAYAMHMCMLQAELFNVSFSGQIRPLTYDIYIPRYTYKDI